MSDSNRENASQSASQDTEVAQLAGALAHEIKNPLSVIRMNMDLLAEDYANPQSQSERRALNKIQTVQNQCGRLHNLLDDFLKYARVSNLQLLPGSLNDQIERVLDFIAPRAETLGIEIVRYLDADLPSIVLDAETLYAALLNLVLNATQAMSAGGTLTARTRLTRSGVALDLIDTGCGMNSETAMHMFDAFYTTKEGGSGLGLPIARRIIEAHGARIDVQSELGRGTQFTLAFPMPPRITEQGTG